MVTEIDTAIDPCGAEHAQQRNVFIAEGREWVLYSDGSNAYYVSRVITPLGEWSSPTSYWAGSTRGYASAFWYDGTYVNLLYAAGGNGATTYYRGTPASNGVITWENGTTVASAVGGITNSYPGVSKDSDGYPFAYWSRYPTSTYYAVYVARATNTGGTGWTGVTNLFPEGSNGHSVMGASIPLSSGHMLAICATNNSGSGTYDLTSKYWNTSTWGSVQTAHAGVGGYIWQAIHLGDDSVMVVYPHVSEGKVYSCIWTADSWGTPVEIDDGNNICIAYGGEVGVAYAVYVKSDVFYLRKYSNGSWRSASVFTSDCSNVVTGSMTMNRDISIEGDRLLLVWTQGTGSPYSIMAESQEDISAPEPPGPPSFEGGFRTFSNIPNIKRVGGVNYSLIKKVNGVPRS